MTIQQTRAWLKATLSQKHSSEESAILAGHLLQWATDKPDSFLLTYPTEPVSQDQLDQLTKALERHLNRHKPLQYIMGTVPFLASTVLVAPPILIPRPETEQMTEFVINQLKKLGKPDLTLLDMGTGSGCIDISLAQAYKEASIYAVDSNPEALELTTQNAKNNKVTLTTIQSDLFENVPSMTFDCIVSNPPYVTPHEWDTLDPAVKDWEDKGALVAQDNGLATIKRLIAKAPSWLTKDLAIDQLIIEIGHTQGPAVAELMRQAGFTPTIHKDYAGHDRFVSGALHA